LIACITVKIACSRPVSEFKPVPKHQLQILRKMNANIIEFDDLDEDIKTDLIIDGLIGYSLSGSPRGAVANLIKWANHHIAPILSLDVPSGINTMTGKACNPAIRAHATMTLAVPKMGLGSSELRSYTGELYLANISVPPALYANPPFNLQFPNIFTKSDIVRLTSP